MPYLSSLTISNGFAQVVFQKIMAVENSFPWEQAEGTVASKKLLLWQYFPFSTLASWLLGAVMIRHASFASRAWLKICISLGPKPPKALCFVRLSQDTQHIPFLSSVESHQKRVNVDCIFLQRLTGSLKQDIVYVGIEDSTDFIIASLPALDKNRVDQWAAHCLILSTIKVKRSIFLFSKCSGSFKYFPTPPSFCIPCINFAAFFTSCGVFFEKIIEDLAMFTFYPDSCSYSCRIVMSEWQFSGEEWQNIMVSSANSKWLTLGLPRATLIPCREPSLVAFLQSPERTSPQRMKM